ncbi:hypothetical protein [Hyphomicrobium sp. MC8b]|uniref:hypothetical protein n=1 Tax=Hyphomicrobium sp. MC8b TaxID=300273 RepID=UPI003919EDBB
MEPRLSSNGSGMTTQIDVGVPVFQRIRASITSRTVAFNFVLIVLYAVTAAATFQGYYSKWTMSDETPSQSLISMLDGIADRPYVYRQLLPATANLIEKALPERLRSAISTRLENANGALKAPTGIDANKTGYVLRYRIVYYLTFLSLFAALFVLKSIGECIGAGRPAATVAPIVFAIMIPVIQTRGGYFYDYPELLAFALAARLALAGQVGLLLLLAVPATLNKESYAFFTLSLWPLLLYRVSGRKALIGTVGSLVISLAAYAVVHQIYSGNPGSTAIFQFFRHLSFYANPLNLFGFDQTYGLPLFKGYSLIMFAWIAVFAYYGWPNTPHYIKAHIAIAAIVNIPLFFLFCAEGEMRNLSMLYVGFFVLMAMAMQKWLQVNNQINSEL